MIYELNRYRCKPDGPCWALQRKTAKGWHSFRFPSTFRNAVAQVIEFNLLDGEDVEEAREIIRKLDEINDGIGRLA